MTTDLVLTTSNQPTLAARVLVALSAKFGRSNVMRTAYGWQVDTRKVAMLSNLVETINGLDGMYDSGCMLTLEGIYENGTRVGNYVRLLDANGEIINPYAG